MGCNMPFLIMWNHVHQCCSHMMPLAPALAYCDASDIISGTIAFLRSWPLKWGTTWLFWSHDIISSSTDITWCHLSVSHGTNSIVNGIIAFLRLIWSKCCATSRDSIGIDFVARCIPGVKIIKVRSKMTFVVMWCHWNWHWHYVMPLVQPSGWHDA